MCAVPPDCAGRRSPPWPGSAPTTTFVWSRAATATRRRRCCRPWHGVFRLDATATEHLLSLTTARPPAPRRPRREVVPLGIRQLLDTINLPAFVESRMFDVLAANRLATAVSPNIRPGVNRLRALFLDPAEQDLHPDWEQAVRGMVAGFRTSVGSDVDDPRIVRLVGELSLASDTFRRLWARHDVTPAGRRDDAAAPPPGRTARTAPGEAADQ
ncbi:hypothetical protein GCM10017687_27010 [Streptomyces echinatus]